MSNDERHAHGKCNRVMCVFSHQMDNKGIKLRRKCRDYMRGFCSRGPVCPNKHIRRVICPLYITGFCPQGPNCSNVHPKHFNFFEYTRNTMNPPRKNRG
ncbi:18131_t:CDS:2, partial [Cetraspora pellucida]